MLATDIIGHSPETKPFWDAAAAGQFVLPWCQKCHKTHWYPRGVCPHCLSPEIAWKESPGEGEIYSFSVNRMGGEPYVAAYVRLGEGPMLLTNVIGADPTELSIGKKVKVVFMPAVDRVPVPLFSLR